MGDVEREVQWTWLADVALRGVLGQRSRCVMHSDIIEEAKRNEEVPFIPPTR